MSRIFAFVLVAVSCGTGFSFAQEAELETILANDLNRLQTFFMLAHNGINGSQRMEPTEEQRQAFSKLQSERELIQTQISEAIKEKDRPTRIVKMEALKESLSALEKSLTSEILLPHQLEDLRKAEFAQYLRQFKGDFARVVENYYGREFGMTSSQKKRWETLRKSQELKKQEANREYNEKLRKIEDEARAELAEIFTPKQAKMIRELSGINLEKTRPTKNE